MRRALLVSIRMAIVTIVLVGVAYPLVVWGISSVAFPRQAGGSFIVKNGVVVGSRLVAQGFSSERYFHPRPSAAGPNGYDAMASSASNLGPTSKALVSAVASRVAEVEGTEGAESGSVPVDLVTASSSGLDPDISPDAAYLQVRRVAQSRGLPEQQVRDLVAGQVTDRQLGFLGEPRVNVLELNLALDELGGAR